MVTLSVALPTQSNQDLTMFGFSGCLTVPQPTLVTFSGRVLVCKFAQLILGFICRCGLQCKQMIILAPHASINNDFATVLNSWTLPENQLVLIITLTLIACFHDFSAFKLGFFWIKSEYLQKSRQRYRVDLVSCEKRSWWSTSVRHSQSSLNIHLLVRLTLETECGDSVLCVLFFDCTISCSTLPSSRSSWCQ